MTDRKHVAFVCPIDLAAALEREAARNERSVSGELRSMLRDYLAENEKRSASPAKADAPKNRAVKEPVGEQV